MKSATNGFLLTLVPLINVVALIPLAARNAKQKPRRLGGERTLIMVKAGNQKFAPGQNNTLITGVIIASYIQLMPPKIIADGGLAGKGSKTPPDRTR